jgi:hypothetical protein
MLSWSALLSVTVATPDECPSSRFEPFTLWEWFKSADPGMFGWSERTPY